MSLGARDSQNRRAAHLVVRTEGIVGKSRRPRPVTMILRYPEDALYEEMAFIAYHFHWTPADVLNLEHAERHRWIEEISKINRRITEREEEI